MHGRFFDHLPSISRLLTLRHLPDMAPSGNRLGTRSSRHTGVDATRHMCDTRSITCENRANDKAPANG